MSATSAVDRLARQLVGLERRVRIVEVQPQLGHSSLDDAAIKLYIDGLLRGYVGKMPGGGTGILPVNAPPPPQPAVPTATGVPGGIEIRWDGTFVGDDPTMPNDYTRTEIHVSKVSGFTPSAFDTMLTSIESPRGGTVFVRCLDQDRRYIRLVGRNTSGKASPPSVEISAVPLQEALGSGARISFTELAPAGPSTGDVWYKLPENAPSRWDGVAWVDITDTVAIEALNEANAARLASADAKAAADEALLTAAGKGKVYYQISPPAGDANGLWIDTDAGNLPHVWNGTAWIAVQDAGIQAAANAAAAAQTAADTALARADSAMTAAQQAQTVANTAQTTANGKNKAFYQDTAPPTSVGLVANDLWFQTNAGFRMSRWSGSAWVLSPLGNDSLAASGIDAGKITVGLLSARRIGTGVMVAGQTLIAGGHDSAGNLLATGGRIEINDAGIRLISRSAGVDTVNVNMTTSGSATFRGDISGSSGTFTGSLSGVDGTFNGTVSAGFISGGTVSGANITVASSSTTLQMGPSYFDASFSTPIVTWNHSFWSAGQKPRIGVNPSTAITNSQLFMRGPSDVNSGVPGGLGLFKTGFSLSYAGSNLVYNSGSDVYLGTGTATTVYARGSYVVLDSNNWSSYVSTHSHSGTVLDTSNHSHGTVPAASSTTPDALTYSQGGLIGTSTTYARSDHAHGMPAAYVLPSTVLHTNTVQTITATHTMSTGAALNLGDGNQRILYRSTGNAQLSNSGTGHSNWWCYTIYRFNEAANSGRIWKHDIREAPDAPGVANLAKLKIKKFKWNADLVPRPGLELIEHTGVIADEVPPEFMDQSLPVDDPAYGKIVNMTEIHWASVKAIQELAARLTALEQRMPAAPTR